MADRVWMPRALDTNGDIVSDATAYFFSAGTTTALAMFSDKNGTVSLGVSVPADADGSWPDVYTNSAFKIDVQDGAGVSLPGYPRDFWHSSQSESVGAATITHEPNENNSATNVQAALNNLSTALGDESTYFQDNIKGAADQATLHTNIGLGDAALRDVGGNVDFTLAGTDLPTRTAVKSFYDAQEAAKRYTSPAQTITSGGLLTLSHGLGATPLFVTYRLKCLVADGGYAVDDEIIISTNQSNSGVNRYSTPRVDDTNIYVRFSSTASVFSVGNKSTGANADLTNASWELYVSAMI